MDCPGRKNRVRWMRMAIYATCPQSFLILPGMYCYQNPCSGVVPASPYGDSQNTRIQSLLVKAGYTPLYPEGLENLCCGMPFSSKGFTSQGNQKTDELGAALKRASNMGEYPILMDTSPCTQRLREYQNKYPSLRIYDIAEFLLEFVVPRLTIRKRSNRIALHVPCSLLKTAQ